MELDVVLVVDECELEELCEVVVGRVEDDEHGLKQPAS